MDEDINLFIFATRLKQKREEKELSMQELSDAIGTSKATISRYESGKRDPNLKIVMRIADYFKIPLEWLCGLEEAKLDDFIDIYNGLSTIGKESVYRYSLFISKK